MQLSTQRSSCDSYAVLPAAAAAAAVPVLVPVPDPGAVPAPLPEPPSTPPLALAAGRLLALLAPGAPWASCGVIMGEKARPAWLPVVLCEGRWKPSPLPAKRSEEDPKAPSMAAGGAWCNYRVARASCGGRRGRGGEDGETRSTAATINCLGSSRGDSERAVTTRPRGGGCRAQRTRARERETQRHRDKRL